MNTQKITANDIRWRKLYDETADELKKVTMNESRQKLKIVKLQLSINKQRRTITGLIGTCRSVMRNLHPSQGQNWMLAILKDTIAGAERK